MLTVVPSWVNQLRASTTGYWVHVGIICALFVLFWSSFLQAALVDPGYIPPDWWAQRRHTDAEERSPLQGSSIHNVSQQGPEPQHEFSYCTVCSCWKPKRAHHCSRCNRCSLKFDHHCFYIGTCVGYRNQKYFYLLLVYGSLCLLYFSAWTVVAWVFFAARVADAESYSVAYLVLLCLSTLGLAMQTPSLTYMLGLHTYLISKNTTNLEWVCCAGKNPACHFDRGSIFANFQEVLGVNPLLWWLPIRTTTHIHHRGFHYQSTFVPTV